MPTNPTTLTNENPTTPTEPTTPQTLRPYTTTTLPPYKRFVHWHTLQPHHCAVLHLQESLFPEEGKGAEPPRQIAILEDCTTIIVF